MHLLHDQWGNILHCPFCNPDSGGIHELECHFYKDNNYSHRIGKKIIKPFCKEDDNLKIDEEKFYEGVLKSSLI